MIGRIRLGAVAPALLALALGAGPAPAAEGRGGDVSAILFNTYGGPAPDGSSWVANIHAWVYEEREGESGARAGLERMQQALGLETLGFEISRFRERARPFLFRSERGRRLAIVLGDTVFPIGRTAGNGHVEATIRIPSALVQDRQRERGWVSYSAVTLQGNPQTFRGAFQAIEGTGFSVISDIDDTIKITDVLNRKEMLANTFLREYRPVQGMPKAYQQWAQAGAVFHYVSASPWQLYDPLAQFLQDSGFPEGSLHLKPFRWKDPSLAALFASPQRFKPGALQRILRAFPRRRFILVGDSGERDPEIYGALARRFPRQIAAIWIRAVGREGTSPARLARAFAGVPPGKWGLFSAGSDLPSHPLDPARRAG